jgi:putative hydrolase of the HAD superfamily
MTTQRRTLRLVFDLDDTLYPERAYALGGFRAAADHATARWGVGDLAPEMTRLLDRGLLGPLFAQVLTTARPETTPGDVADFVRAYGAHSPQLELFPDATAVLDHYRHAAPLGLITDGHAKTQIAKVTALNLTRHFQSIIYTGALGADRAFHKPHPRAFQLTEDAIGHPGDQFVYVGDNPAKDFAAPNARGWITVHIQRPGGIHGTPEPIADGAAHHTITDLMQLPETLKRFAS